MSDLTRWGRFEVLARAYDRMKRALGVGTAVLVAVMLTAGTAWAQEFRQGAARWEITAFPGGGLIFTEGKAGETDFSSYALGASVTRHLNRYWGVEAEIGGGVGVRQQLALPDGPALNPIRDDRGRFLRNAEPPSMMAYQGNVVVYPTGNDRPFAPYVTGGVGGLSLFSQPAVGLDDGHTYLTGNVGTGAKMFFGRWGLRGDYRLIMVDAEENSPAFFGRGARRHGHRVYGGILLNLWR